MPLNPTQWTLILAKRCQTTSAHLKVALTQIDLTTTKAPYQQIPL